MSDWEDSFADRMRSRALQRMQKIPLMKATTDDTSEEPASKKRNVPSHNTESLDKENVDTQVLVSSLTPVKPVIAEHLTIRKSLVIDKMECDIPEVFVLTSSKKKAFAEEIHTENRKEDVYVKHCKNRLANLAGKFKQFEEEDSHVPKRPLTENNKSVPVKRRSDEYEPAKGDVSMRKNAKCDSNTKNEWKNAHVFVKPPEPSVEHSPSRLKTPVKPLLDQSTINALESQGFTKKVSDAPLVYDFNAARNAFNKQFTASPSNRTPKREKIEPAKTTESKFNISGPSKTVDSPRKIASSGQPESARKKEVNPPKRADDNGISKLHSNAKYQSNVFVQHAKKANENEDSDSADPCLLSVAERRRLFEKRMFSRDDDAPATPTITDVQHVPKSRSEPPESDSSGNEYSTCESENNSNNSRMSNGHLASESEVPMSEDEHSECEFERDVVEEKYDDEIDEEPDLSAYPVLQTIEQVNVSTTPKPGCLYPSVSDLDGDAEDDVDNVVKHDRTLTSPVAENSFEKEVLHATDHIFSLYHTDLSKDVFNTRKSNALTEARNLVAQNDEISFLMSSPEARSSILSVEDDDECDSKIEKDDGLDVNKRIKYLEEHVIKEKIKLTQAIRALKFCLSTSFLNSESHLEAEKLVLLSQLKIEAAQNEIDRMKVEKSILPDGSTMSAVRGNVVISKIKLPVKMPNVQFDLRKDVHNNFMCVVKCGATVLATEVVSVLLNKLKHDTDGVYIEFPDSITVPDVNSDFKIKVEVYNLVVEKKDETNAKHRPSSKKDKKTPNSKNKKQIYAGRDVSDGRKNLHSSFTMVGHMIFSQKEIQRHQWILNNYDYYHTPLVGMILMQLKCNLTKITIQKHGFLTMYEVVSGYGAWSRNWFYLDGEKLSFWKYPEQEMTQDPIGTFDLKKCVTKDVTTVGYDIVFRPQTFMLEFDPPTYLQRFKGFTENRLLLSADNEEERKTWCDNLSEVLKSIRCWSSSDE